MEDFRKPITDYGATIAQGPIDNWRQSALPTGAQFVVERGRDPSVLAVAFTGFAGRLSLPTFDFLRSTELLNYNRILLRDNSRTCYLSGIPPVAQDVDTLIALLRQTIDQLGAKRTLFIGSSGGSHAAILFGHLLQADFVHSFSPHTNLEPAHFRASESKEEVDEQGETIARMNRVPEPARAYFDLREVLRGWNGKTHYNLHVCTHSAPDLARAVRLDGLPGVTIHRHDCDHHRVVVWLARRHHLLPLLKLENQPGFAGVVGSEPKAV